MMCVKIKRLFRVTLLKNQIIEKVASILGLISCIVPQVAVLAADTIKLSIEPLQGRPQYHLVYQGVREVLIADLSASPQVAITSATQSDLTLQIYVREKLEQTSISLSLIDQTTRYNMGTKKIAANYADIKDTQNQLYMAALELLNIQADPVVMGQTLAKHTANVSSLYQLGSASSCVSQNKFTEALQSLRQLKSQDPEFEAGKIRMGALSQKIVATTKDPVILGQIHEINQDMQKAQTEYDLALKANPKNALAHLNRGRALLLDGKTTEALKSLEEARILDGQNSEIQAELGKAYYSIGQSAQAFSFLLRATQIGTQDVTVYKLLGDIHKANNKSEEASRMYQNAGDLAMNAAAIADSKSFYAQASEFDKSVNLTVKEADAYIRMGEIEVAITYVRRALLAKPSNDQLLSILGFAYYSNKQYDLALKSFFAALETNPKNYVANYNIGLILSKDTTTTKDAIKYLEIAASIRSDLPETSILLSELYSSLKRYEDAIKLLENSAKLNPGDANIALRLGDTYLENKQYDLAFAPYEKAISLSPFLIEAHEGLAQIYIQRKDRDNLFAKLNHVFELNASDNLFIRKGSSILSPLLPDGLLKYVREFPKSVGPPKQEKIIHQVTLLSLLPGDWIKRWLIPKLRLYKIREEVIKRDLSLALFCQYRVVPSEKINLQSKYLSSADFENKVAMKEISFANKLEAIFGSTSSVAERTDDADKISVSLNMFVSANQNIYGPELRLPEVTLSYPGKSVIWFDVSAVFYNAFLLVLFLGGTVGGFVLYRRNRGWGIVNVQVNYDSKSGSFLTLKLSKSEINPKDSQRLFVKDKEQQDKRKFKGLLKQSGAFVKEMITRDTVFESVPAGKYYCYLFGTVEETGGTNRTVGNYFMFQKFDLKKNTTAEIVFQVENDEAYVTVNVMDGDKPVDGAEVSILGKADAHYTRRDKGVFFYLKRGTHKAIVKYQGKIREENITIHEIQDKKVIIDLADASNSSSLA